MSETSAVPEGALTGIRVIDLTRILAGPFCTMLLADMGAEVIKIESPSGGDAIRTQGVIKDGMSWYFAQFNRNKKSVTLDLYTDEGKAKLAALLESADVLVENFRPGVLAKMGFDEARLKQLNPKLIVGSVNGYGSTGPYVNRPSFDFIAQAMSGFMSLTGEIEGEPMRAAPPMADLIAGLYCAFGVVTALAALYRTGEGQYIEASLNNSLISMMAFLSAEYFATGKPPARSGNNHAIVAPYGMFKAKNGAIAVAPSNETYAIRFLDVVGLGHLMEDDRFRTNADRMRNRVELLEIIDLETEKESVDHWIDVINGAGCPCGRVMGLEEVFADPQVRATEMVLDVDHGDSGIIRMTGFPVKMSKTPPRIQRPAPQLGEHNDEILGES
ncbi:MAG: carnitine dehydratase [Rhodospirillaceae bacterium]|nr:carnitine dehydratase [Rhodospirillaceae bacterium]OUX28155.1 MAG: carnitine dehydratase [Rhodospirillaceae bacterium TMED256]